MSAQTVIYASGVIWLAASLQGVTGFGFMMLALPGLILGFPAQVLVPALFLIWLPLGTAQALQLRADVDWRALAYLAGSAAGSLPLGAVILQEADTETMQRGVGGMMVGLALLLQVKPGPRFRREGVARIGAGLISGVMASSTSVSGPPVVLLGLKQQWPAHRFRATLLTYFLSISLFCLPLYWKMGLLSRTSLDLALSGAPGAALGLVTGIYLRRWAHGKAFRWVAVGMVMGGGLAAAIL